jgi:hypothetical protein
MGESTSKIELDIAAERNELGRNLQLLERKARSLTDWRTHYRNHPFAMMAVALGGGVLLGTLTTGMGGGAPAAADLDDESLFEPPEDRGYSSPSAFAASAARARRQFGDTWDHIADALLAVAAARAIQFVADKVPGFREEFAAKHPEHRGVFSTGRSV